MLTTTPAVLLGKEGKKGCVAAGADADLLILDENLEITQSPGERKSGSVGEGASDEGQI